MRFERERREEQAVQERRDKERVGRRMTIERLERQLEAFSGKCVICAVKGRVASGYKVGRGCVVDAETIENFRIV